MPYSTYYYKNEIREHFIKCIPITTLILDVGAGWGIYSDKLRELGYRIDGIEIWEPYVNTFYLNAKYDNLFIRNVLEFDISNYDYLIFGDIIEHMTIEDAQRILKDVTNRGQKCLVGVPYMAIQGAIGGNIYETHLQPDLTHNVVLMRYPQLKLMAKNDEYGYYINYELC